MRYLKYIFYLIFFLFIALELHPLYKSLFNVKEDGMSSIDLKETQVSVAYSLDTKRYLIFSIPSGAKILRVLTNLDIPKESIERELPFEYNISYEVLNHKDEVIFSELYYHHTKVIQFMDTQTGQKVATRFYLDKDSVPSSTKKFYVHLNGLENPEKIRFVLHTLDPDARGATLRSYYQSTNPEHKLTDMWRRLNSKTKERLSSGNVYDTQLLNWTEKKNLLSSIWKPFGPLGVRGEDYILNNIYSKRELDELEEIPHKLGQYLEPPKRLTYILEDNKSYSVETIKEYNSTLLFVDYYDKNLTLHRYSYRQESDEKKFGNFQGGFLEIYGNDAFFVNVYGSDEVELKPSKISKNYHYIENGVKAHFKINHIPNFPTPLRISYRLIAEQKDPKLNISFDKRDITLQLNPEIAIYDSHNERELPKQMGKEDIKYFLLPEDVKSVTISSGSSVLINVAVAVASKETISVISAEDDVQEPKSWYQLNPLKKLDSFWVQKGVELPIDLFNPKVSHNQLEIVSDTRGREILTQRDNRYPIKFYQYPSIYTAIEKNRKITGEFKVPSKQERVDSTILYKKRDNKKATISFYVNNALMLHEKVSNKEGTVQIPQIKNSGFNNIEIKTEGAIDFWISGFIKEKEQQLFMKRYVSNLEKPVSFRVHKKDLEPLVLSFKVYSEINNKKLVLNATLKDSLQRDLGPFSAITFKKRSYEIYGNQESQELLVLGTDKKVTEKGTLFFTLGDDMQPGVYTLEFHKSDSSLSYIYGYEFLDDYRQDFYLFKELL